MKRKTTKTKFTLAITYEKFHDDEFDAFASECGSNPDVLREATETAIRTRHHEARIDDPWHRASGRQPDIFTLSLGLPRSVQVVYTVEPHAVVIRGYAWDIVGEPRDDDDGGYFYYDDSWITEILAGWAAGLNDEGEA